MTMGKKSISTQSTAVREGDTIGASVLQTVQVDDLSLPTPEELERYKQIDPRIVDYLLDQGMKEQKHRHQMDAEKMKIVRRSEGRSYSINWWGMFFALVSLVVMMSLAGFALYLDAKWLAGIFGVSSVVSVVSIFVNGGRKKLE